MRVMLARARFWYGLSDDGVKIRAFFGVFPLLESFGAIFREVSESQQVVFPDSRGFLFFLGELNLVNVGIFADVGLDYVVETLFFLLFV